MGDLLYLNQFHFFLIKYTTSCLDKNKCVKIVINVEIMNTGIV